MSAKKRVKVAAAGKDVTNKESPQNKCMICEKVVTEKEVISCGKCSCGNYCSQKCMNKHENHINYCPVICSLEKIETEKRIKKRSKVK